MTRAAPNRIIRRRIYRSPRSLGRPSFRVGGENIGIARLQISAASHYAWASVAFCSWTRVQNMRHLPLSENYASFSERSRKAVSDILISARDVLVEQGYPRLTMRNVAERAGISVGNLNYYFANKQDLLRELLQAIIQGYVEDFSQIIHDKDRAAIDRFESVVRFIMGDLETRETTGFFPALWALANHDPVAAHEMDRIYDVEKGVLADLIAEVRPDLSEDQVNILALFVMGAIEGQTVFVGFKRKNSELLPVVTNAAAFGFRRLVSEIDGNEIARLS